MLYFLIALIVIGALLLIFWKDEEPPPSEPNPLAKMMQARIEALHAERQMYDIDRDLFRGFTDRPD